MLWVNFGTVVWGYDGFRSGLGQMFERNDTVKIAVTDITYVPVGDMIMAWHRDIDLQPKAAPTGARRGALDRPGEEIDGRWVYVLDHTTRCQ